MKNIKKRSTIRIDYRSFRYSENFLFCDKKGANKSGEAISTNI